MFKPIYLSNRIILILICCFFTQKIVTAQALIEFVSGSYDSEVVIPGCTNFIVEFRICNIQGDTDPLVHLYLGVTDAALDAGTPSEGNFTYFGPNNTAMIGTIEIDVANDDGCKIIEIAYPVNGVGLTATNFAFDAWNATEVPCSNQPTILPGCDPTDIDCVPCTGVLCSQVCQQEVIEIPISARQRVYYSNEQDNTISDIYENQNVTIQDPPASCDAYSFVIEEDLLVDEDWCLKWTASQPYIDAVAFEPGKKIIIPNGVTAEFEYMKFKACSGIFWEAIEVMPGGSLIMVNCIIEDGRNAIKAHEGATLNIKRCNFADNYIGISLVGDPLETSPNPFSITLYDNNFVGSGELVDPYVGQTPTPNRLPYSGINLENVNFADLAAPSPTSIPTTNFFDNMYNGVLSFNSSFIIKEAQFSNMKYNPSDQNPDLSGYGIFARKRGRGYKFMQLLDSSAESLFTNMRIGISINNMDGQINEAIMNNVETGIEVKGCVRSNFIIQDCEIDATGFGIHTSNNTPLFGRMINNTINLQATNINPTGQIASGGIVCTENVSPNGGWNIDDNDINLIRGDVGLHYSNGGNASITNNHILKGNGKSQRFQLIELVNAPRTEVSCNILADLNESNNFTLSVGLDVKDSPQLKISCNEISSLEEGVAFDGTCESTDFRTNTMSNGAVGLNLTALAVISPQAHKGNCFNENEIAEAIHNSSNQASIEKSKFTVKCGQDQSGNDCICPDINTIFTGTNNPSDFFGSTTIGNTATCEDENAPCLTNGERPEPKVKVGDISRSIAVGESIYEEAQPQLERMMQYHLYSALDLYDQDVNNSDLQSFYHTNSDSDLAKIHQAMQVTNTSSSQDDLIQDLQVILSDMEQLDQTYFLGQIDEGSYLQRRIVFANNLRDINDVLSNSKNAYSTQLVDQIANQSSIVGQISGANVYDSNMKWILDKVLLFRHPDFNNFSDAEWADIYVLATQCSVDAGHAVYVARSLYHSHTWLDFNALQNCNPLQERKATDNESISEVSLYPNPTSNEVTIEWDKEEVAIITILDTQGRVLLEKQIAQGNNKITVDQLIPGVYYYTVESGHTLHNRGKLIIIK